MGRWEPDAQQRLVSAALDLFVEKGYDMTQALRARGVSDLTASIAAELGVLAFRNAFARWAERSNQQFGELARESLEELQTASALLT